MANEQNIDQLLAATQQINTNPQGAIEMLRPMADAGDSTAAAFLAYLLGPSTNRWAEGIPYAKQATADGNAWLSGMYGQNLIGQPDPAVRQEAPGFLRHAIDEGWPIDLYGPIVNASNQGALDTARQLLAMMPTAGPSEPRRRWELLIEEVGARRSEVNEISAALASERDSIAHSMREDGQVIASQREEVERLAQQVGVLANQAAGRAIAQSYADRAAAVETRANWYTGAALVFASLLAVGGIVAAVVTAHEDVKDGAVLKLLAAIPLVALNFYVGRLGGQYRKEAVELRHIELQFNTANPFLADLDPDHRKSVLAELALRFFPGQALPGTGASPQPDLLNNVLAAAVDKVPGAGGEGKPAT